MTDARGAVMIMNVLPGHKAAHFRMNCADVVVRYLGGDHTLISEIKRNAEIQSVLPADHPMAMFRQSVAHENGVNDQAMTSSKVKTYAETLVPSKDIEDLGTPAECLSPNVV